MDIVFSANNREEVITFPYTPAGIEISESQSNDVFSGLSRNIGLIGNMDLRTVSISGYWFKINPSWANSSAKDEPKKYVEFFQKWRAKKVPVRLVISESDDNVILNMACTIDDFTWSYARSGDISYSLKVTEYTFVVG